MYIGHIMLMLASLNGLCLLNQVRAFSLEKKKNELTLFSNFALSPQLVTANKAILGMCIVKHCALMSKAN